VKRSLRERLAYDTLPPVGSALRGALVRAKHPRATLQFDRTVRFGPGFHVWMPSGRATLEIGPHVQFRRGCVIELEHDSLVRIGAGTVLTYNVVIQATVEVTIGERCLFANGASVVDSKHAFRDADLAKLDFAPVHVGDDVWVASKATVAADVGDRAVIGANSVVTRPIEPFTVAAGAPARELEKLA
jgi:acetyltransferase-like isoleucine patch superfamily enzyme